MQRRAAPTTPLSRVAGLGREHAEIDADLLERLVVFAAGILPEDQFGIGCTMQPAVVLDFILELSRCPARVAKCQDGVMGPLSPRDCLENVERRSEADALVNRKCRVLQKEVAGMEHKSALGIDRTSLEDLHTAGPAGQLNALGLRN